MSWRHYRTKPIRYQVRRPGHRTAGVNTTTTSKLATLFFLGIGIFIATPSSATNTAIQVLLQGPDPEKLKAALQSAGGSLTHDLPIVNGVGGEIELDALDALRDSPGVQRVVEDFNPGKPPATRDCAIAGDLQLSFGSRDIQWRLHNFSPSTVQLTGLDGSWPDAWGSAALTLRTQPGEEPVLISDAAKSGETVSAIIELPPGPSTLALHYSYPLESPKQDDIDLLVRSSICDTELLPAYEHYGSDFYYGSYVDADLLHQSGILGAGIGVAIIDSGLWNHPSLTLTPDGEPRVTVHYDAIRDVVSGSLIDKGGHGSHMASIIANSEATQSPGASGFKGIAPASSLIPITAVSPDGDGDFLDIIRGIQWVINNKVAHNIRVLNLSLTATPRFAYWDDPMNQAVLKAWQAGITVVVAAGNDGSDWQTIGSPGNNPYVITVGALTDSWTPKDRRDDYIPDFSSRGPTPMGHIKPDVVAPGGHITGLIPPDSTLAIENPNYLLKTGEFVSTGSSQSAAVVSGMAALLLSAKPELSNDEIKCLLMTSAEPAISTDGRLAYSPFIQGSGSANVARALTLGDIHCAQSALDIDFAVRGKEKLEGPATRDANGAPSLPNIDKLLNPKEPSRGLSDDRRWGVKAHLERLDPAKDAPQATGVPFDWGGVYQREAEKIQALSEEK